MLIDLLMFVILTNNICSVCLLLLISLQIEFFTDYIKVRGERITNKIFLQISLPILLPTPNTYMQRTKINVQRLWGSTAKLFSYTIWHHLNPNIHRGPMIYLNKATENCHSHLHPYILGNLGNIGEIVFQQKNLLGHKNVYFCLGTGYWFENVWTIYLEKWV